MRNLDSARSGDILVQKSNFGQLILLGKLLFPGHHFIFRRAQTRQEDINKVFTHYAVAQTLLDCSSHKNGD